jgi:cohesin domain-containing protein
MSARRPIKNVFMFILILPASWILIHLFAVFGIFLLVSYPIWILTNPSSNHCLFRLFDKQGKGCFLCTKPNGTLRFPSTTRLLNTLMILVLTFSSMGIVLGEKILLESSGVLPEKKTAIFDIPMDEQYKIGEIFLMPIEVKDIEVPINAIQADIKYDEELLEIVEILTNESFANIFIQKEVKNDLGFARLTGGLPNPGYSGESLLFAKVLFRCKDFGSGEVEILKSSLVLANDDSGSNILASFPTSSYQILPERITEAEHDFQNTFIEENVLGVSDSKLRFFKEEIINVEELLNVEYIIDDQGSMHSLWDYIYLLDKSIVNLIDPILVF